MNWCQPHWDQLRAAIEIRGLSGFIAKDEYSCAANMRNQLEGEDEKFDPLMGAWTRINGTMLKNDPTPTMDRMMTCPLCLLVKDGRPELVENWIDGVTDAALKYAIDEGLVKMQ